MSARTYLAIAFVLLPPAAARADYVAQRGDVLEVVISNAPALNRRVAVSADGKITLPLVGEVAADTSLTDLRQRLQAIITSRNVVQRPDVMVSVFEYGPIYVDGDVARPGEYRYRPEMTVRDAIALAGGLDTSSGTLRVTASQIAEARGDYGTAAIELARHEARALRLKAEMSGATTFEAGSVAENVIIDHRMLAEIIAIEAQRMAAELEDLHKEKAHRERMLAASREELTALGLAQEQQQALLEQQTKDALRSRDLLQKGVGTVVRTEDTQHALAQARAQVLDNQVRLAQARKEVKERARSVETFDDQWRAKLLEALQDAVAEANKARFRIEAARERMAARADAGGVSDNSNTLQATVRRVVDGAATRIPAGLDTALRSGDNIAIRADARIGAVFKRTAVAQ